MTTAASGGPPPLLPPPPSLKSCKSKEASRKRKRKQKEKQKRLRRDSDGRGSDDSRGRIRRKRRKKDETKKTDTGSRRRKIGRSVRKRRRKKGTDTDTDAELEFSAERRSKKSDRSVRMRRRKKGTDTDADAESEFSIERRSKKSDTGGGGKKIGRSERKRRNKGMDTDMDAESESEFSAERRSKKSDTEGRRKKIGRSEPKRRRKKGTDTDAESESEISAERRSRRRRRRRGSSSSSSSSSSSPERLLEKRGRSRKVSNAVFRKKRKGGKDVFRGRYRSPSCSTCSSSDDSRSRDEFTEGDRLKYGDVAYNCDSRNDRITNLPDDHDGRMEIIQDYIDFPSSNDSLDGNSKRKGKDDASVKSPEVVQDTGEYTRWNGWEDDSDEIEGEKPRICGENDEMNCGSLHSREPSVRVKSVVVMPVVDPQPVTDDLETILRQKALENLKKFRGCGKQKDVFVKNDSCEATGLRVDTGQDDNRSSHNANISSKAILTRAVEKNFEVQDATCQVNNGDKFVSTPTNRMTNLVTTRARVNRSQVPTVLDASPAGSRLIRTRASSETTTSVLNKSLDSPNHVQREQNKHDNDLPKQVPDDRMTTDSRTLSETVTQITDISKAQPAVSDPSSIPYSNAKESSTNQPKNDSQNISEMQNKTMTVMRGGELVQVNYKVYIPKKAPALARRKLKR